jgi:hypothetical protein
VVLLNDHALGQAVAVAVTDVVMSACNPVRACLLVCGLAVIMPLRVSAQQVAAAPVTGTQPAAAVRDGQHDFDFDIGTWKTHLQRRVHPLSGSTTWIELDGTTVVRKIWNGRANLAELEAATPTGRLEVLSLRLYDPQAGQWSLNTANSKVGTLGQPTVGGFKNGRGEFFDQESFNGRAILVRNVWSNITADSCRFEQAFSADGGKTWEVNWIAVDTRVTDNTARQVP